MALRSLAAPVLATAVSLLADGTAYAVTLQTPFVFTGSTQVIRVQVSNLGKKDTTVTVTLTNANGATVLPNADNCAETAPLEPGATCNVGYNADDEGRVTVTASGKISAALNVIAGTQLIAVVPATK